MTQDATEASFTRLTMLVPGAPASAAAWGKALSGHGLRIDEGALDGNALGAPVPVEWVENDGEFGAAFSFGTVSPEVIATLEAAPGALLLRWPIDLREGRGEIVALVERLREVGAIAVRLEESKVGWDVSSWIALFGAEAPWSWHRGAVAFLGDDEAVQSCGMHAFSLPDVRIALDDDAAALQELASVLEVYQLSEDPILLSGQTFAPDAETPRRVLERWPDTTYPPDHPCHNPYGVWRLGPRGGSARPTGALVPVFMPPLRALLAALEARSPEPLTREQVESTRDEGACIMMKARDAQKLERSRGYADLDPELAWEQWQLVREKH